MSIAPHPVDQLSPPPSIPDRPLDFNVAGGQGVPPTVETLAASARFPEAAAALQALQTKPASSGWVGLLVLGVSLLISAGAGAWQWSPKTAALILAILFVHELGHYVAMRLFGYREVRMFFVPLLGAAVTGRKHNVPGWKKALVSLAGPVPGIFLGAGLAAWAIAAGNDAVASAAGMAMLLNGINLLPILPLDGGWFWNAVLFCRHRWLEAGFKVVAGLACCAASAAGFGRFLLFLGLVVLFSVPATLLTGGVAARLRRGGWRPAAPGDGDEQISPAVAESIFVALYETQRGKKKLAAKLLATHALQVFERLNARAPNGLESLGLAVIYAGALFVAVLGFAFTTVFTHGLPGDASPTPAAGAFRRDAVPARPNNVHPPALDARFHGEFQRFSGREADEETMGNGHHLAATFPDARTAAVALEAAHAQQAPKETLALFGQSVLASVPRRGADGIERAHHLAADLRQHGAGLVLDDAAPRTAVQANFAVTAASPEAAARLHREVSAWLGVSVNLRPPAPWHLAPTEASLRAAETLAQTQAVLKTVGDDPEVRRAQRQAQFKSIFLPGRSRELFQSVRDARQRAEAAGIARLQAAHDPALDPAMLAQALRRPAFSAVLDPKEYPAWQKETRRLLHPAGTAVPADDAAAEGGGRFCVGEASVSGTTFSLTGFGCADPARELPAVAQYLVRLGGGRAEVRYDLHNGAEANGNDPVDTDEDDN